VPLDIAELEVDDANEAEFARHGVTAREIFQLLEGPFRVFRNKKKRAAQRMLIGPTRGGRLLTVPISRTAVPGRWRPVSAWDASPAERTKYEAT
jgi:uncharacterized DUF497 family protein